MSAAPLLKAADVARLFDVKPKTVNRWVRDGRLIAFKTPGGGLRFRQSEVDRFMAGADTEVAS